MSIGMIEWMKIVSAAFVGNILAMLLVILSLSIMTPSMTPTEKTNDISTDFVVLPAPSVAVEERLTYNYGNIRKNNETWKGEVECRGAFKCFDSPETARRSVNVLLRTYYNKYSLRTISDIVRRYAPPFENSTDDVIATVSLLSGFEAWDELSPWDLPVVADAIIKMETGN